jgi:hypothetical protein
VFREHKVQDAMVFVDAGLDMGVGLDLGVAHGRSGAEGLILTLLTSMLQDKAAKAMPGV